MRCEGRCESAHFFIAKTEKHGDKLATKSKKYGDILATTFFERCENVPK